MASLLPHHAAPVVWSTRRLRAVGWSKRAIARAAEDGMLIRVRRGRYLAADTDPRIVEAARVGGRLDCISLLEMSGVFVLHRDGLHLQQDPLASRRPPAARGVRYHWRPTRATPTTPVVDIVEALAQAVRCQAPRAAVATLDSAWHLGLVDESGIAEVFQRLPRRFQVLQRLLDPRSETGTETLVRLILKSLGCHVELQVRIAGVGRVDLVVNGWLIVECDSKQFHGAWHSHKNDRRRDLAALERGFATVRLLAEDVLFHPDRVRAALERIVAHGAPGPNS
ncbi:endonuclease domain-containing protein [Microbacterium sp. 1P10AE]|uniref:endonuclease domain-containing protein n=1 Tax=Microbacterium sp. 1P10AE TaxID=3132286 RepID=UPI0039A191D2